MPARLFCKTGELAGAEYEIGDEAIIGRDDASAITLRPSPISGRHARIYMDRTAGAYFLEDLGSSNGTELDGTAVKEPRRLDHLNVVTFAREFEFIFQIVTSELKSKGASEAAKPPASGRKRSDEKISPVEKTVLADDFGGLPEFGEAPPGDDLKTRMGDDFGRMPEIPAEAGDEKTRFGEDFAGMPSFENAPAASARFFIEVKLPGGRSEEIELKEGKTVVGRLDDADVTIRDSSVSRRHAQIEVKSGRVTVKDLGTKNFTYADGSRVVEETEIAPGATIRFGPSILATLKSR